VNVSPHIILACLLAGGSALASVPSSRTGSRDYPYAPDKSPFTSPAKVVVEAPVPLLADWSLAGVAEVQDGYLITLSHRQKAGERMTLRSAGQGTFKVDRVDFGKDWRETVVHISSGGLSTALRFDPAAMVPASKAAATAPVPANSLKTPAPAGSIASKAPATHPH